MPKHSLGADEAADILGVSKSTLYSYVSRGMITSRLAAPGSRKRLYDRAELLALKHRSSFRKDPETAAADVIEFGIPILTTGVSQITETEHSYRGVSSRELAAKYSFEQVAEFLWTGRWAGSSLPNPDAAWEAPLDLSLLDTVDRDLAPIEQMQSILPRLQHRNLHAYRTNPDALLGSAIELIKYLVYLSSKTEPTGNISESLGATWDVNPSALETLLIVVADHKLNIATFTARCAASAGSSLYQAVLAGMAALQGYRHLFGQVSEAKMFMGEVIASGDPESVVRSYFRRRGAIPGVQNPYRRLYSGPDPRVLTLVENLSGTEHYGLLLKTLELIDQATSEPPRVDFALAVSEPLLGLPHDSIHSIIAIGRTAGMIAHVFEQYGSERVIRPRARYVGEVGRRLEQ